MIGYNGFASALRQELKELNFLDKSLQKKMAKYPDGTLHVLRKNGRFPQFYSYHGRKKRTYIPKDDVEQITELAQKEYDQNLLEYIEDKLRLGSQLLKEYEISVDTCYERMNDAKKMHVSAAILPDKEYIDAWYKEHPGGANTFPMNGDILSNRGECMRSKSEKILADMFEKYQIPYVYEPRVTLKSGRIVYPDFLVLNKRLRRTYIYEHFGLMSDMEYVERTVEKIMMYQMSDYMLGTQLLFSMESRTESLNVKLIEKMIQTYLL